MRRGEGGITLLEVIVAMALFAAAIYARLRMEEALLVPVPVEGAEQGSFAKP